MVRILALCYFQNFLRYKWIVCSTISLCRSLYPREVLSSPLERNLKKVISAVCCGVLRCVAVCCGVLQWHEILVIEFIFIIVLRNLKNASLQVWLSRDEDLGEQPQQRAKAEHRGEWWDAHGLSTCAESCRLPQKLLSPGDTVCLIRPTNTFSWPKLDLSLSKDWCESRQPCTHPRTSIHEYVSVQPGRQPEGISVGQIYKNLDYCLDYCMYWTNVQGQKEDPDYWIHYCMY